MFGKSAKSVKMRTWNSSARVTVLLHCSHAVDAVMLASADVQCAERLLCGVVLIRFTNMVDENRI